MKSKSVENDIKQEIISVKEIFSKMIEKLKKKNEYHWNFSIKSDKKSFKKVK